MGPSRLKGLRLLRKPRSRIEPIEFPKLERSGIYPWLSAKTGLVPHERIQAYCDALASEFHPHKIILFGSFAYGQPTPDSDVDLLIIMPYRGRAVEQVVRIRTRVVSPFPLDLLVRTPQEIEQRLAIDCFFTKEVLVRGKVMYEAAHS